MTRLLSRSLVGLVAVVAMGACSDDSSSGGGTGGSAAIGATGGAGGSGGGVSSGCTVACGVNQVCDPTLNACVCSPTAMDCGAGCQDITSTATSCGSCTTVCDAPVPLCSGGLCVATCDAALGLQQCGTGCVNISSDPNNCGACSTICPSGQCVANACVPVAGTGGATGTGGTTSANTGGTTSANTGGTTSANTGGTTSANTGGTTSANTGGTTSANTGGTTSANTGGTTSANTGGTTETNTGGITSSDGGTTNTGGTTEATGGTTEATGGTTNTEDPPGYVRVGEWYGCAWTGTDTLVVGSNTVEGESEPVELTVLTSIDPQDFTQKSADEPFCASGTVGDAYQAVALLGFNTTEPADEADCTFDGNAAEEVGFPGVGPSASAAGIAVNISSNVASSLRIQIQGPNGGTDASDRWCYDLEASGQGGGEKAFAPYAEFNTQCWNGEGNDYNGEPISAVVFLVPGTLTETPYEFCVLGFIEGNTEGDAPDGFIDLGPVSGTIGGDGADDLDFQRAKVTVDGEQYVIQNNNWGGDDSGYQTLTFEGNSFAVTQSTGNSTGNGVPASFPSMFVGQNGDKAFNTTATDNLPKQISQISSAHTTFAWGPSNKTGDFNVAYDVWFASDNPPNGGAEYGDAVSGFIMVWLYDPSGFQPIGNSPAVSGKSIPGVSGTWDVWAGERGASEGLPSNRPVISYVATSTLHSVDFDLNLFIQDAVSNSYNGFSLQSNWYLTDVFAGFEIWGGPSAAGLTADYFTIDVQ